MPVQIVEVPDIDSTAKKQILDSVVVNFLEHTGLKSSDVYFMDPLSNSHQPSSTMNDDGKISFSNGDRITLEFDEQRNEETRISRRPGFHFETPFFLDKEYNVKLMPSMVCYDASLTIRRRAASRAILTQWINEFQRKADMSRNSLITMSNYFYYIPYPALNLLAECYRARTAKVDYGDTLKSYLRNNFSEAVTVVAGEGGVGGDFAVKMNECRIVLTIEDQEPRLEKYDDGTAWTAEVTCKFTYSRPEAVVMSYPMLINNTMLSEQWWMTIEAPGLSDESGCVPNVWVDALDKIIEDLPGVKLPVTVPHVDEPYVGHIGKNKYAKDLVRGYLSFDHDTSWIPPADWKAEDGYPEEIQAITPVFAFNMNDIPDMTWSDNFLEYLRDCIDEDPQLMNCIVKPMLYENNVVIDQYDVAMDEDFNVWTKHVPNLLWLYRFSISIELNWRMIGDDAFNQLRKHPAFVQDVIKDFFPNLVVKYPSISTPNIDKFPAKELDDICQDLAETLDKNQPSTDINESNLYGMMNILNGRIITYRGK